MVAHDGGVEPGQHVKRVFGVGSHTQKSRDSGYSTVPYQGSSWRPRSPMPIRRQTFADDVLCGHIPAHTRGAPPFTAKPRTAAAASVAQP